MVGVTLRQNPNKITVLYGFGLTSWDWVDPPPPPLVCTDDVVWQMMSRMGFVRVRRVTNSALAELSLSSARVQYTLAGPFHHLSWQHDNMISKRGHQSMVFLNSNQMKLRLITHFFTQLCNPSEQCRQMRQINETSKAKLAVLK